MKNTNITDSAINNINRKLIYKFTLDGKELPLSDVMNNPTITYDCGLDQYSVGNLYIGELSFSVKNTTFVNYKSEIVVTVDIQTDSGTISTKLGKFYVDTVVEQGVTKQIKAYDGMFLLNVGYFPSARHTTTKAIVDDIASKHNLTILGFENRTANINNEQIDGKTVLEMLQLVAGVHGGSIFMNGDGAVKFVQATDTGKTYTKSQYSTPTLDTSISYNITKLKVIYGEKTTNEDGSVKDEGYFEVGEGLDSRTLAISNVLLKGQQTQAQNILNVIKNMNGYNRFDTTILLGDYRLEPMDVISYVKDDKTYKVPIIYMQIALTYSGLSIRTQSPTLAESKSEFSFKGTITQKIDNVYTEMMQVKDIVANSITVGDLEAINAEIENLQAKDATITNLVASKADITDLNAVNAEIDNLQADYAEIGTLVANKADITSLHATNARVDNLQANVAGIDQLLAGNITSENIQARGITSDRLVIDDGFISDAMIDTVSASKILSGSISTGSVSIQSEDGKLVIADETIQISDGTNVRVQIGETANGDYAIVIYDEDGNVMFDATGITEHAIKDSIIKDDMVADDANINGKKIDITSLVTAINEDGSSTINVSKIYYDSKGQTLEVAFNEMTTRQNELEDDTEVLTTQLNVQKGEIETLVQNSTITHSDGTTTTLKDAFSQFQQTQNEINLKVEQNISNIEASDVGATNLLRYTDLPSYPYGDKEVGCDWSHAFYEENTGMTRTLYEVTDCLPKSMGGVRISDTTGNIHSLGIEQNLVQLIDGETYTMSAYFMVSYSVDSVQAVFNYGTNAIRQEYVTIDGEDVWKRLSYTFTYNASEQNNSKTTTIRFGFRGTTYTGYICGMKLEKGSMATDWSPSPYDIGDTIDSFEQRIESAELKVSSDAIVSTVTSSSAFKTVQNDIDSLESRMNKAELKITDEAITSTVTNSTIFQEALDKSVEDYDYEGRNLLKHSKTFSEIIEEDDWATDTVGGWSINNLYGGGRELITSKEVGDNVSYVVGVPFYPECGELLENTLTVTFDFIGLYVYFGLGKFAKNSKSTEENEYTQTIDWIFADSMECPSVGNYQIGENQWSSSQWLRCTHTFTVDDSVDLTNYEYRLVFKFETNTTFPTSANIRKPIASYGSEQVEWTSAPEDLDEELDNLGSRINVAESKIEQNANNITLSVSEINKTVGALSFSDRNLLRNSAFQHGVDFWNGGFGSIEQRFLEPIETGLQSQFQGFTGSGSMTLDNEVIYDGHPSLRLQRSQVMTASSSYIDSSALINQLLILDEDTESGVIQDGEIINYSFWYYVRDKSKFHYVDDEGNIKYKTGITCKIAGKILGEDYFLVDTSYPKDGIYDYAWIPTVVSHSIHYDDIVEGVWTKVEGSVPVESSLEYLIFMLGCCNISGGGGVFGFCDFNVTNIMVTKGNKALTSWTPAPEDTHDHLADLENQVVVNTENISSLQVNADSISASVQEVVTSIDTINGDITNLTNKVNATMSAEDIQFLISSEINNTSVGKVTTETGYVFDKDGLMISKSNSEMKTQITEDGMTVYKNNNAVLVANNEGVDAVNLHATTYLIVGDNSRFENYGSDRTGCFFIKKGSD